MAKTIQPYGLDPGECFRAGAGAFASTLLIEMENGKSMEEIKTMCEEVKPLACSRATGKVITAM